MKYAGVVLFLRLLITEAVYGFVFLMSERNCLTKLYENELQAVPKKVS